MSYSSLEDAELPGPVTHPVVDAGPQRFDLAAMASCFPPKLRLLSKSKVEQLENLSPAAVHSCRLAVQDIGAQSAASSAYVASAADVFKVVLPNSPNMAVDIGKESVYLPKLVQASTAVRLDSIVHQAEVQSMALHTADECSTLVTVDAYGKGVVASFEGNSAMPTSTYALHPSTLQGEAGWAGAAISSRQSSTVAVARHFVKDVTLYNGDAMVRRLAGLHYPHAVAFLPPGAGSAEQLLALAEGHQVSLWDERAGERGGCVQRMPLGLAGDTLYCLSWCRCEGGMLAAGGAERAVTLLDTRKWRTYAKWASAARFDIYTLNFCECDPHYAVISGFDYEVVCGRWDSNQPSTMSGVKRAVGPEPADREVQYTPITGISFRGDSRWLGFAKAAGKDTFAGVGASGHLFVAKFSTSSSPDGPQALHQASRLSM